MKRPDHLGEDFPLNVDSLGCSLDVQIHTGFNFFDVELLNLHLAFSSCRGSIFSALDDVNDGGVQQACNYKQFLDGERALPVHASAEGGDGDSGLF